MENYAELMQRLLELRDGGRQRSPELIAEDKRLMDGLHEGDLAGKPTQPGRVILNTTCCDGGHIASGTPRKQLPGT